MLSPRAPASCGRRCRTGARSHARRIRTSPSRARPSSRSRTSGSRSRTARCNTLVLVTRLDDAAAGGGRARLHPHARQRRLLERLHRRRTASRSPRARRCATRSGTGSSASWSRPRRTATSPTWAATGTKGWSPGTSASPTTSKRRSRCCAASVFSDRGVYRLGEEVHLKAILRSDTAEGMRLLDRGTARRDRRSATARARSGTSARSRSSEWSSADWALSPARRRAPGQLRGRRRRWRDRSASISGSLPGRRLPAARLPRRREPGGRELAGRRRRSRASSPAATSSARRWPAATSRWTYTRARRSTPSPPWSRMRFPMRPLRVPRRGARGPRRPVGGDGARARGQARRRRARSSWTSTPTSRPDGRTSTRWKARSPTSRGRRSRAARRSASIPRPGTSACGGRLLRGREDGRRHRGRGGGPRGQAGGRSPRHRRPHPGPVALRAPRRRPGLLHLGDRAQGDGGRPLARSRPRPTPAPLHVPVETGGYFVLPRDRAGRGRPLDDQRDLASTSSAPATPPGSATTTTASTSCRRRRPTGRARRRALMIKSPWESALALLTTEREGVRTHRTLRAHLHPGDGDRARSRKRTSPTSTSRCVLVKGRSGRLHPGRHRRSGQAGLPRGLRGAGGRGRGQAARRDGEGGPRGVPPGGEGARRGGGEGRCRDAGPQAEVTLWAVDYGVLSLTAYKTPDVLRRGVGGQGAAGPDRGLAAEHHQPPRRSCPKGGDEGGGGGAESGPGTPVRKDFRVLAFWLGSRRHRRRRPRPPPRSRCPRA